MFLARLVGAKVQVYPLIGSHKVRAWRFWSYQRGAAAIGHTELQAIVAARRLRAESLQFSAPKDEVGLNVLLERNWRERGSKT